jgi:hypothetical protein
MDWSGAMSGSLLWAHEWRRELGLDVVHLVLDSVFSTSNVSMCRMHDPNCQRVPDSQFDIVLRFLVQVSRRLLFYEPHL